RRQKVIVNLPSRLMTRIDAKYMRMVLENLINNASKYSPNGKTVTITGSKAADCVSISVRDQGIGIGKKDQKRLYQKFSRLGNNASSNIDSNGLGLYWSKQIIDLHDGNLELVSRLKRGSTFTLKLPV